MGSPGKVRRTAHDEEVASIREYADRYVDYRLDYMASAGAADGIAAHPTRARDARLPARGRPAAAVRHRRRRGVYERYGFEPLETPALENIETLTGKYGEEGNKLIYKVLRRGERKSSGEADLALRYDLTVPLARVVAEHAAKLPRFFKRYQIQPVWRADRPARGRFREFYQCDVDAIGSTSPVVEVGDDRRGQRGAAGRSASATSRCSSITAQLLTAMLDAAGIAAAHARRRAGRDRQARQDRPRRRRARELVARGIERGRRRPPASTAFEDAPTFDSSGGAATRAATPRAANIAADHGRWPRRRPPQGHVKFTPRWRAGCRITPARSWRSRSTDLAGSLGGGGRYDGLIGMFSGETDPGVRLLARARAHPGRDDRAQHVSRRRAGGGPDVLVTIFDDELDAPNRCALAGELRAAGLRVERLSRAGQAGQAVQIRGARGARAFVAVLGSDEIARGEVTDQEHESAANRARCRGAAWRRHLRRRRT